MLHLRRIECRLENNCYFKFLKIIFVEYIVYSVYRLCVFYLHSRERGQPQPQPQHTQRPQGQKQAPAQSEQLALNKLR